MLADCRPDLAQADGLKVVPHWTTFQKGEARLLQTTPASLLFSQTIVAMVTSWMIAELNDTDRSIAEVIARSTGPKKD